VQSKGQQKNPKGDKKGDQVRAAGDKSQTDKKETKSQSDIFAHLAPHNTLSSAAILSNTPESVVHPVFVSLGLKYSTRQIRGSNARCDALLHALEIFVSDFSGVIDYTFESKIKDIQQFLTQFRPISLVMSNIFLFLNKIISKGLKELPTTKQFILQHIRDYRETKIINADREIRSISKQRILDGDVIMVYASSSIVRDILLDAQDDKKKFRVIVVDSAPHFEGLTTLKRFTEKGIKCTYVLLSGVSYIIKEVTKMFIGAQVMFSNGLF